MSDTLHFVPCQPRIAYQRAGQGPVVVFLHGVGGNHSSWRRQIDYFRHDYTVVAWDARGYGASDDYDGVLQFSSFADDLARLLDHLGAERAHLVGLSMGARILMDFYPDHASRAATLTLCDCFFSFEAALSAEKQEEYIALRQRPLLEGKTFADLAPALIASLVSAGASPACRDELLQSILALRKDSYLKTIAASLRYDRGAELTGFDLPVQLIFGEADALTPPSIGQRMAGIMPDARLAVLPGAGHLSNMEAPEAFNAVLEPFLATHAPKASSLTPGR